MLLQLSVGGPDPQLVSKAKGGRSATVQPVTSEEQVGIISAGVTSPGTIVTTSPGGQGVLVNLAKDPEIQLGSSSVYKKPGLIIDCGVEEGGGTQGEQKKGVLDEEEEAKLRQRWEEEECRIWLQKVRDRRDHQRQISNLSLKLLFPSHSLPKSTTMRLLNMKVCSAIRAGDLKTVKQVFEISTDKEREELLQQRQEDNVVVRRPSNGKDIVVSNPTLLMVSVSQWFVDIVDYLASFGKFLDEEHIVDDVTNNPRAFRGVTALHIASLSGKLSMVESLVRHGANVNRETTHGDTPLFEACFEGHLSVAQFLLDSGADATIANGKGTSCLMIATYADNAEVIQYLMARPESDREVNRVDRDGRSALFYTVAGGRLDTLVYLLENGASIMSDKHGVNILIEAAHHEQTEIVYYLLEEYPKQLSFSVCDQDNMGRNVLFYLVENKSTKILELLLYHGVPIEPADDGRTFLMTATLKNNKTLVKYLLEHANKLGLNPNERDKKGRNALFYCITGGDVHMFEMLIAHGMTVSPSADGITVLMQGVAKQKTDFTELILRHKENYDIDVNARDKDGWGALLYSVASGNLDIFRLLKAHGAKSHQATDGRTILMQAAAKGDSGVLDHILNHAQEYEVYVNQRDEDGWNALFYTIQGKETIFYMKLFSL